MKKSLWLHNIRSAYNVGSLLRTADAVGIDHVYFSGYTPTPIDRFGRARTDIHKIALGAEESLSWSILEHIPDDIIRLKEQGTRLVCIEQDEHSIPYTDLTFSPSDTEIIIAVGEETEGIPKDILKYADNILEIPMRGNKESLNVSVAFGIVAYRIFENIH